MTYAIFTTSDVSAARQYLGHSSEPTLFMSSLRQLEKELQSELDQPIDVPGQGEAGSYEHNRHKANYELMDQCSKMYLFRQDKKYLIPVRDLLLKYADVYLDMPFHEQKNTNPPGRLFHQILNEHMWLFYASLAYNIIKEDLPSEECQKIEDQLFRPMIDMFTVLYGHDFDRIHNHGIWAVAAVGLCALNVGDDKALEQSIYGLNGDRTTGGFLAQISGLFADSGYYIEGPYYHRFAIRPLVIFAEAIHLHFPELDIYQYNNGVIGKTVKALLLSSNPDGTFPALNDASLTMNITDEGAQAALSVYIARYGADEALISAAKQQGSLWLSPVSRALSEAVARQSSRGQVRWPSVELQEGHGNDRGAQGFLRSGNPERPVSQAIMAYGQHGMGHGHFDTLSITLFADNHEYLREYGYARWVNVETKFGGRYLAENKSWARQTIAHNAVTVDRKTQNRFDSQLADSKYGLRHFFIGGDRIQAMSAYANDHYDDVNMQRTLLMIEHDDFEQPLIVDLYRLASQHQHHYDLAVHYRGQVTHTNLDTRYHMTQRNVLGEDQGYQHLFEKARAEAKPTTQVTWLQDKVFHSWNTAAPSGDILFAQTGANDPEMNLRTEDCFILRLSADNQLFASTYETHGLFDEATERCRDAVSQVREITVLYNDDQYSVVQLDYRLGSQTKTMTVCVANDRNSNEDTPHALDIDGQSLTWSGYFAVLEGYA